MLEKIKNTSLITKILYVLALVLFLVWVIPSMVSYYSNVNKYESNMKEIRQLSSKHGLSSNAQVFSVDTFKERTETLFTRVSVEEKGNNKHNVTIRMKREDIKAFHTFIETLSLRYLVQIVGALEFEENEDILTAKFTLVNL